MTARDDWLDSNSISDSWWNAMTPRQKREYQTCDNDRTRHYLRKQAFMDIFQHIYWGTLTAVAVQKRADGKDVEQIVYLDRRYFRNSGLFAENHFTELRFAGDHYQDIRVKFPDDWTDAQSYEADRADLRHAPAKVSHSALNEASAPHKGSPGRPSMKPLFIEAFRALSGRLDLYHSKRKDIDFELRSYFRAAGHEIPNKRTVYKYIKELRDNKLLI